MVSRILEAEKKVLDFTYEDLKGLRTFFNFVDPDELTATNELVFLPTLVKSASMVCTENHEIDQFAKVILFIVLILI